MNNEVPRSTAIPNDVLNAIAQRLDDCTKDARVELDPWIADEGVKGRGYEALLMLPGAIAPSAIGLLLPRLLDLWRMAIL
ncbi:hypothetical protein NP233_g7950 [Leucocoprinus birnbaumii]|uniref:Uncharacterized protein n=1 Tax=Leucocoprinus birnbaumii TaxID=56174 RepID=A0AAD5VQX8_9AGAR|nr:hypothetical protein NP233_g7950 [Leucocoprinus birnbaumii]